MKRRIVALFSASVCLVGLASAASAQEVTELPPVVVEGATIEAPPARAKKSSQGAPAKQSKQTANAAPEQNKEASSSDVQGVPIGEIGSAVTVVTGEQLRAQQIRYAAEALRSLPGVSVSQTGSPGGKTQVRIRGAEANHTLVIIDGIEANDPSDGDFDWSNMLSEDIERIEVIRGAQSGLYGSKAIGGVINIITKGGRGPLTLTARTEYGGYNTKDIAARASGGTDKAWLSVSGQFREQNDFNIAEFGSEDDPWHNSTVSAKGGVVLFDGMTLDFVARRTNKFVNTDPEGFILQTGLNAAVDGPNTTDVDMFIGGLNLRWDLLDGAFTQIFKANRAVTDTASTAAFGDSDNLGEQNTYGYLATYRFATPALLGSSHTISGLIERQQEGFTPISAFTDGVKRERERDAVVAEYRGGFYDRVFVSGTVRHDDNDKFADFTTWHSGVSIVLPEVGLRPHASTGTGVALPGMFEQFGSIVGIFVGNPDLVPEESFSWDAGVEFTVIRDVVSVDVTYFEADLTNEIAGFGNTLINQFGESTRSGIEVASQIALTRQLSLGAAYTFLDARDPKGLEEVRRPRHSGRADIKYLFDGGRGTFDVAAIYNGDMTDSNFGTFPATIVPLDEYWLVTVAASYRVTEQLEVFGRVENALDEQYEEVSGYNTLGVAAYAGVRMTLEDPSTASWAKYK